MLIRILFGICISVCVSIIVRSAIAACNTEPGYKICDQAPSTGTQLCTNRSISSCAGDENRANFNRWGCVSSGEPNIQCYQGEYTLADCYTKCTCYSGFQNGTPKCLRDNDSCQGQGATPLTETSYGC